jgi:transcriptional regulator with XRE-family HTH domain
MQKTLRAAICERLMAACKALGETQQTLARRLTQETGEGWSQARVSKVLNGKVALHIDQLAVLTRALHLSLTDLLVAAQDDADPIPQNVRAAVDRWASTLREELAASRHHVYVVYIRPEPERAADRGRGNDSETAAAEPRHRTHRPVAR